MTKTDYEKNSLICHRQFFKKKIKRTQISDIKNDCYNKKPTVNVVFDKLSHK